MAEQEKKAHVALVVGVTGINGHSISGRLLKADAASGGPWKVYGTGHRERPEWLASEVEYVGVDLLNKEDALHKLSPLKDVTHFFWATWLPKDTEEENCEVNGRMLRNSLDALLSNSANSLQHICLTTGSKHYLGPFERFGSVTIPDAPFREDMPRLPVPNFYYVQEDIVFETVKNSKAGRLTYSVHRPNTIFGFAPRNYMNCLAAIAVYATICKREKIPFAFSGSRYAWESLSDASDADLIAEQEIWAATDPRATNEAFNVTNGDVFKWKRLWQVIADKIGVEAAPYEGNWFSLVELMKDKEPVWDSIVKEHNLRPTKLKDVGQFWFVDVFLNLGPSENVSSMNKSKEHGFFGFRNSEKSVQHWIDRMREKKIVP